jgi:hypothetical protein
LELFVFLFLSCALHPGSLPSPPFFFFLFSSYFFVVLCVLPLGFAGRD